MIKTEEQRRWWFATHPEYRSSHKGIRQSRDYDDKDKSELDPRLVDAYADEALKYSDGTFADIMRTLKQDFGTEAYLRPVLGEYADDGWVSNVEYIVDGGAFMPRLPTTDELLQWPREAIRGFFEWLDSVLQNNPLLVDPDSLESHHALPKKHIKYFMDCGLKIKDFIIIMRAGDHRLKPDGLHTGKGLGGDWSREWDEFIYKYPNAMNTPERQDRIKAKLQEMKIRYRIDEKIILLPSKAKAR